VARLLSAQARRHDEEVEESGHLGASLRLAAVVVFPALLQRLWIPQRRRWSPRRETVHRLRPLSRGGFQRETPCA
jgi:hypothetical protein